MSIADSDSKPHSPGGHRALIAGIIVLFAAMSAYLALVIITRVDHIFFPGRELTIPVVSNIDPGLIDAEGKSGSKDPINILVLGLDRRPSEEGEPTRTDTIFILRVNPKTKAAGILGIPRDLRVNIPDQSGTSTYEDRINSVYVEGELNGYDQGGINLLKETIDLNFGVEIDKYVMVDFEGFEKIIDALGGIDVDVPDEVYDPYFSFTEEPGDYDPQHFEVGRQHMDGHEALAYSRIRFSSDDLDRIQRQQRVIFAAIEKAKSLNVLGNAPKLWDEYKNAISTDISDFQIPGYADLANSTKDNLHAVSLGPATAPCTGPRGAAWLCGDEDAMQAIVDSVFSDDPALATQPTVAPEPVRVLIQNGAGVEGLGSRVVSFIAAQGYPTTDLLQPMNSPSGATARSEIIDIDGTHEKNAYLLAQWLGIDVARVRTATTAEATSMEDSGATIVVLLGADEDFDSVIENASAGTRRGG